MTDKTKIIFIYIGVAVISVIILFTAWTFRGKPIKPPEKPYYAREGSLAPMLKLKKDLILTNQDGQEVKISDLQGKVWAFAQFYASCPMCVERNSQGLKTLYEAFKDDPDFHLVCITVSPQTDGVKEMKSYAEAIGADTSNWWFLTGDAESLKEYMISEMKYQPIIKRKNPEEAATKGIYAHDMAIAIYNRDLSMIQRQDLYHARLKGDAYYKGAENKLHFTVKSLLDKK